MNAAQELAGARSVLQAGLASTMSVPLWTGAEIKGVMQVDNRDAPGLFAGEDLELLTVAAGHISFAAENARLVRRLRLAEDTLRGQNRYLKDKDGSDSAYGIIGESTEIASVLDSVSKVSSTRVPVLISGETGTGKELVARAIHTKSGRGEQLFVAQNCSALPESLLESTLFGHVRGAFTGADRDKKGLFEIADGGTVFLDELGEMALGLQAKLLRVLQEGEIWPVGAVEGKRVNIRVVSATHRNLEEMTAAGQFREDLYYRLCVYPIEVPPLRKRRDDIPLLANHFLGRYAAEFGRTVTSISGSAMSLLQMYDWPGNVRELQNEIQRVLIQHTEGEQILPQDLSPRVAGQGQLVDDPRIAKGELKEMMESVEKLFLIRALEQHQNNKTKTAKTLGITREGLHKKLNRFGL
jgi:Nif-specific regulatory protein